MNIENFYMTVGKVIPEFDGKLARHMDIHAPSCRITLNKIRKLGRGSGNLAEAFEQILLFATT